MQAPLRVPLQTVRDDARPLFCVHPVGGQVAVYRALAECLAPVCPVHGLQAPDAAGHPPASALAVLVERHVAEIRTLQPNGPYRLAGWSTGGLFAVAVADALRDAGETVEYLGLIDTHALPQTILHDEEALIALVLRAELAGRGLAVDDAWGARFKAEGRSHATLLTLPRDAALRYMMLDDEIDIDPQLFAQLLEHVPRSAGHLALLRDSSAVSIDASAHRILAIPDGAGVRVEGVSGRPVGGCVDVIAADHHAILREPHVVTLAACIAAALEASTYETSHDSARLESLA